MKLKAAIEETKSLDVTKAGKYTVGAWMDEWFENYAKIKVRPSSHQTYRGYIDNHIKPNIGKIPLEKLTSLELQKLYKKLLNSGRIDRVESKHQAKGLSPKTVRNIHQIIASAMKLAKEQKIIATDPTEGCALPKLEHREMKTLPVEQLTSFLREAKDSGVFEMYYVELATGLRTGRAARPQMGGHRFRTWQPPGETADRPDQRRGGGGPAENEKRLPDAAAGGGHDSCPKTAEERKSAAAPGYSPHPPAAPSRRTASSTCSTGC